jgi:CheY-like chemotaxis protein
MRKPIGAETKLPLVLIVEDANFNLHAERITLESAGYDVINTETGANALPLAQLHHPDLVILDLGLPDVPGLTVIRDLKADESTCTIPVLVCSADDRDETIAECRRAGCVDYLTKPFSADQLIAAVTAALGLTSEGPRGPNVAA